MPKLHGSHILSATLAGCLACTAGTQVQNAPAAPGALPASVRPGLEVMLRDSLELIEDRRIGLVTNQSGIDARGRRGLDLMLSAGLNVAAVFAPEHGLAGTIDVDRAPDRRREIDSLTGKPVYLLHDGVRLHPPTPEMLSGVDVLVVDLQDAGARYYTYPSAVATIMQAAVPARLPVIVLDRPNPIGGAVQGQVQDSATGSAVARFPVAMRHGMTIGELALLANSVLGIGAELHVIPVQGWRRSMLFDATGLPFVPPSLNLRTLESLHHYPGLCLFEGTNLTVGRGSDAPFEQVGAPWIDTTLLLATLRREPPPGVSFSGVAFTPRSPGDGKYSDTLVMGVRLRVLNRDTYDPTLTAASMLSALHSTHSTSFAFRPAQFDRLAGGPELRAEVERHVEVSTIAARWRAQQARFILRRRPYLLYAE